MVSLECTSEVFGLEYKQYFFFKRFLVLLGIKGYGNELFMQNRFKTIQSNEHSCCKDNETSFPQKCLSEI